MSRSLQTPGNGTMEQEPDNSTEGNVWNVYEVLAEHSDDAGFKFEVKQTVMLYVRGLGQGRKFSICANMKAAGAFDDVIYVDHEADTSYMMQLKHKQDPDKKTISLETLTASFGGFGLMKYLKSYLEVKQDFEKGNKDLRACGEFRNMLFVFFTNGRIDPELSKDLITNENDNFVNIRGNVYRLTQGDAIWSEFTRNVREINEFNTFLEKLTSDVKGVKKRSSFNAIITESVKNQKLRWKFTEISKLLQKIEHTKTESQLEKVANWHERNFSCDETTCAEFLKKLVICDNQPSEGEYDELITKEINDIWIPGDSEVNTTYDELLRSITNWCQHSPEEKDVARSGEAQKNQRPVLKHDSRFWPDAINLGVKQKCIHSSILFKNESIKKFWNKIYDSKQNIVFIYDRVNNTQLTFSKLLQSLRFNDQQVFCMKLGSLQKYSKRVLNTTKWSKMLVIDCDVRMSPTDVEEFSCELIQRFVDQNKKIVVVTEKDHLLINALKGRTLKYQIIEDETSWRHVTDEVKDQLRIKTVSFQGERMSLSELINNNDDLSDKIDSVTFDLLLKGKLVVGKELTTLSSSYIPRFVKHGRESLLVNNVDDMLGQRTVVLIGQPGLGKSTLVTHVAQTTKHENPKLWVVRLNLQECSEYLKNLALDHITTGIDILRRFSDNIATPFEEAVFTFCLNEGNILAFFDGFDEISPLYEKQVLTILEKVHRNTFRGLWVTSRFVTQEQLVRVLGVKPSSLNVFSKDDQVRFLNDYWKCGSQSDTTDSLITADQSAIPGEILNDFTNAVLHLITNSVDNSDELTSVPQLLQILAEHFLPELEQYQINKILTNKLNINKLCKTFVGRLHGIYFQEKKKVDLNLAANMDDKNNSFKLFTTNHSRLAVLITLDPTDLQDFEPKLEPQTREFIEKIRKGEEKTGIIDGLTTDDLPRFISQLLTDYFVAIWLHENQTDVRNLLRRRSIDMRYKRIKEILNGILTTPYLCAVHEAILNDQSASSNCVDCNKTSCSLHQAVLNEDIEELKQKLAADPGCVNLEDGGGRTALHLTAFMWDSNNGSLMVDIARTLLQHNASVGIRDDVLGWTAIQIADQALAWEMIILILKFDLNPLELTSMGRLFETDFDRAVNLLRNPGENVSSLMEISVNHGALGLIRLLVISYKGNINNRGARGVTLMHSAASNGHSEVMEYLFYNGSMFETLDDDNNTPLHSAAALGRAEAVKFLLEKRCDVNAENKRLETPLFVASASRLTNEATVEVLIDWRADLNHVNEEGMYLLQRKKRIFPFIVCLDQEELP